MGLQGLLNFPSPARANWVQECVVCHGRKDPTESHGFTQVLYSFWSITIIGVCTFFFYLEPQTIHRYTKGPTIILFLQKDLTHIASHLPAHWLWVHALKNNVGSHTFRLIYKYKKTNSHCELSVSNTRVTALHTNVANVASELISNGVEVFHSFLIEHSFSSLVLCFPLEMVLPLLT